MYEVFPIVAGILIGLLVPRFVETRRQRRWISAFFGVVVAGLATIVAGEEWFFIVVDLIEVFAAMGITIFVVDYFTRRSATPIS